MIARRILLLGVALALAAPAFAQQREGIYAVSGSDPIKGAYSGQVELRWDGTDYAFLREVEFSTFTSRGRSLSLVWSGRARDVGSDLGVSLRLDRMGWSSRVPGQAVTRTAADGVPMPITATFRASGSVLAGSYQGQGAPFADPSEQWSLLSAVSPQPIWRSERRILPAHSPAPAWIKWILFRVFRSFHNTAWVQPYVPRPEFQAAMHYFVYDRTDFALHRRRPDLLRVIQRIADPLTVEEAHVKANAFGKPLHVKARAADLEIPQRFLSPTGALTTRNANGQVADGDGALWTGVYAYTQNLRYGTTQEPAALANVERTVGSLRDLMEITGQPDTFARTTRAARGAPTGGWHAGTGAYAGTEWLEGGNNDMFSGLMWGALTAHEALPANHSLRADYGRSLRTLVKNSPVVTSSRILPMNETMGNGMTALLVGPGPELDRYRQLARNPYQLLYNALAEGGLTYQGITDWSGTHLGVSTQIMAIRLAEHHSEWLVGLASKIGLRRAAKRLGPLRRSLHVLASGALANIPFRSRTDASDGVWALRELPYPRNNMREDVALREDFVASPYPALPWKMDFTKGIGRTNGHIGRPLFERFHWNYTWKDRPFPMLQAFGAFAGAEFNSADYLFGYWLARAHGLIGPNE